MLKKALELPTKTRRNQKDITYIEDYNGCWICTSHSKDADGYFYIKREFNGIVYRKIHRLVYAALNGELREDEFILHSCDNPSCINPAHLSKGTHQDNMNDRMSRGRYAFNGLSRLSEDEVIQIYNLAHSSKLTQKQIGSMFGISVGCVADIKHKRNYKTVLNSL